MNNKKTNKNLTAHISHHTSNNNNCKKIVGALSVRNTKEDSQTAPIAHKGITLIALIITIIVMLILVGVTITVAINGGVIDKTKEAADKTKLEADRETLTRAVIAATNNQGIIEKAEDIQNSLPHDWTVEDNADESYTAKSPNLNVFEVDKYGNITVDGSEEPTPPPSLPQGWAETEKLPEWDNDKVIAVKDNDGNILPLPDGYQISDNPEENTIEKGVVIKDNKGNEFVWIPVTEDFENSYSGASNYSEPKELTSNYSSSGAAYDSQATLDYLYGENCYNYEEDFAYSTHYAEMVESVNKYNGFYIGRYETTIDENKEIGSKYDTEVLTGATILKDGTNQTSGGPYYYRWYGQYYAERNSNITGNKDYIQTNMIWGQQWDKMLEYFDSKSIDYEAFGTSSQGTVVNSGQSKNSSTENDKIYNIYDLRTNGWDWTAEAYSTVNRTGRGGCYYGSYSAPYRNSSTPTVSYDFPTVSDSYHSSRLTLYIK